MSSAGRRSCFLAVAVLCLGIGTGPARADRSCAFVCGPDVWCGTRCTYHGQLITCLNFGPCSHTPLALATNGSLPGVDPADFFSSLSRAGAAAAPVPAAPAALSSPSLRSLARSQP
jgi:hypothetical protein